MAEFSNGLTKGKFCLRQRYNQSDFIIAEQSLPSGFTCLLRFVLKLDNLACCAKVKQSTLKLPRANFLSRC